MGCAYLQQGQGWVVELRRKTIPWVEYPFQTMDCKVVFHCRCRTLQNRIVTKLRGNMLHQSST
jgi:hypothetical protein